jgi:hypothetical protein
MSVLGHMVSILALMATDITVACYAIQKEPDLLTTQMVYFMIWQIAFGIGMSWYATTFSLSSSGVSIQTDTGDSTGVTTQPVVGVSPDGKTTIVIPTGYSVSG